jgi:hypothetical protein
MTDTYLYYYSTTFPGLGVLHVSYGIVKRLVDSCRPLFGKQRKSTLNSRKLVRTTPKSLNYILQYTPRPRSISQLVDRKKVYRKSQDSQTTCSPVVFKLLSESLYCSTISRLSPSWPLDTTEPFPKEPHHTWKRYIIACRNNSKRGCGRKCKLC